MFYEENNDFSNRENLNNESNSGIGGAEPKESGVQGENRTDSAPVSAQPQSAAAPSGEYHYTRENNPGAAASEPIRPAEPQYSAQNGSSGYYGAQNTAQSGNSYAPNGPASGYHTPSGAANGYYAQNGVNSGYSAQNNGNSGYNSQNSGNSGYGAQNNGYSDRNNGNGGSGDRFANRNQAQNGYGRQSGRTASPVPPKPPKSHREKKSSFGAGKIVALALVCSLVGGMVGAGGMYALKGGISGSGKATVSVSDRTEGGTTLTTAAVSAGESMTPAQIYKTYGDAVVCIFTSHANGTGAGTGFIIDGNEGYVMTCYHVVDGAQSISVKLNDSTQYEATYVGGDKDLDCAILKITPKEGETLNLTSVVLGDSTKLDVGESVCTIGNALGTLANTLTSGTISALDRSESMEDGTVMNVLQTDTSINGGNSGGPLFNSYGEVIGIINSKRLYTSSGTNVEGIAFAIPISDVSAVMSDLMEHGYVTGRPLLGVNLATITAATAQQYPSLVPGAYVRSVSEGSCAEKAGMQEGDIITSFDGQEVSSSAEVIELKRQHKAGDEVEVVVSRKGEEILLKVVLDEDPSHDNPIDDGSGQEQQQGGDYGYGYGYGGDSNGGNGGNGGYYGFPFSFFGW